MKSLTTFLLVFLSVFFSPLFSQSTGLESIDQYIENTTSNSHPQVGLSIGSKRNISGAFRKNLSEINVLRITLNVRVNAAFIDLNSQGFSTFLNLNIGKERHIKLGDRFSFYTGGEAGLSMFLNENYIRSLGANIYALSGLKFKANKRVSFFTEAKFGLEASLTQNVYWTVRSVNTFNIGALYTIGKIV